MPKWTEYTSKDTLADNDEVMLYDATARANKRGLMSKFWDYVVDKMATAVISKLETNNKTIIGAINALNSDPGMKFQTVKNMANKKTLKLIGTNSDQQVFLVAGMNNAKTAGIAVVSSNTIGTSDNCALKSFGDMLFSAITRKKGSYDIELTCAENYTSAIIISNENFSYRTE